MSVRSKGWCEGVYGRQREALESKLAQAPVILEPSTDTHQSAQAVSPVGSVLIDESRVAGAELLIEGEGNPVEPSCVSDPSSSLLSGTNQLQARFSEV